MLDHSGPIGIIFSSPITWLALAICVVVLALTISTRRGNARPRGDGSNAPVRPLGSLARYAGAWSAAQASFAHNPRVGCRQAQAIVASALEARGFALTSELLDRRYRASCAITARADASVDELRRAYFDFRAAFDALVADESELLDP